MDIIILLPLCVLPISVGFFECSANILCCFILNFYIVRRFRVFYFQYHKSKIALTTQKPLPNHLLMLCVLVIFAIYCVFFAFVIPLEDVIINTRNSLITILIWAFYFFLNKLTNLEICHLNSVNYLSLGYGMAIWYYKNYLEKIFPDKFLAGLRQYRNEEGVKLPFKLYVLCPTSCKVKKHIDTTNNIEISKELSFKKNHGGIKDREYHLSVYRIKFEGEYFFCALEYAQPLKTLLSSKKTEKISLSELNQERESFIRHLEELLQNQDNCCDYCELVEYDDDMYKIEDILSRLPSIQDFKYKTDD